MKSIKRHTFRWVYGYISRKDLLWGEDHSSEQVAHPRVWPYSALVWETRQSCLPAGLGSCWWVHFHSFAAAAAAHCPGFVQVFSTRLGLRPWLISSQSLSFTLHRLSQITQDHTVWNHVVKVGVSLVQLQNAGFKPLLVLIHYLLSREENPLTIFSVEHKQDI